jgi:hypothetical protein
LDALHGAAAMVGEKSIVKGTELMLLANQVTITIKSRE